MEQIKWCPSCGSVHIKKNGYQRGKQRYKCRDCNKQYNERTQTIFHGQKLDEDRLRQLIILILRDTKLIAIMDALNLSSRTVYMWRMKIYKVAGKLIENVMLCDIVWIDELLIPVNQSMIITKPDGNKFRGMSRNQVVVACGIDVHGTRYAEVAGRGHITSKQCLETYGKHIEEGSLIYHDGIFSHDQLIVALKAKDDIYKTHLKMAKKAMQPINSFGAEIVRNLVIHIGLRTKHLQDYLNWIVFRSSINGDNIDEKVEDLVSLCFQSMVVYRINDRY